MTRRGIYVTRDYLQGKKMADLAPRENGHAPPTPALMRLTARGMAAGRDVDVVLDDDLAVVTSLADILRAERCVVHTATPPSAALGILRNVKVDAVISDVVMPEMDGYEFYMKVKEEMPEPPSHPYDRLQLR